MASSQKKPNGGKKKYFGLFFLLVLAVTFFTFRQSLLEVGVEWLLSSSFSKSREQIAYDKIRWEKGKILVSGVHLSEEGYFLTIDQLEMGLKFFRGSIEPRIRCIHPELTLLPSNSNALPMGMLYALIPSKFYALKLDVQNGVLQLDHPVSTQRLYFKFQSGSEKNKIGTFLLSQDPNNSTLPLIHLDLEKRGKELFASTKVQAIDTTPLLQLTSFFYPQIQKGWENVQGEMALSVDVQMALTGKLTKVDGKVDLHNIFLTNSILGLHAQVENLQGEFHSLQGANDFWEQFQTALTLHGGAFLLAEPLVKQEWGCSTLNAELRLNPHEEPLLKIEGTMSREGRQYPLNLEGKGSVHEDNSFWLELALMVDSGKVMDALVSICSPAKEELVIQTELKHVEQDGIAIVQDILSVSEPHANDWEISQGAISGKMTAWLLGSHLAKLEVADLLAKNLKYKHRKLPALGSLHELKGDAHFIFNEGFKISHLKADLLGGDVKFPFKGLEVPLSNVEMQVTLDNDVLAPSWIRGQAIGMKGAISFNGPWQEAEVKLEIDSTLKPFLSLVLNKPVEVSNPEGIVSLLSTCKFEEKGATVTGALQLSPESSDAQMLDFGFDLTCSSKNNPLDLLKARVSHGWFRSEKLSIAPISPLFQSFNTKVNVSGDLDLFGTFESDGLQCFIQGSDLLFQHPLFDFQVAKIGEKDPMLLKTEGRAVFSYDAKSDEWKGSIPISHGRCHERQLGAVFEEVQGNFVLDKGKLKVEDFESFCEGLEVHGALSLNTQTSELDISTQLIQGPVDGLSKSLARFSLPLPNKLPLKGFFKSGKEGFLLKKGAGDLAAIWSVKGSLFDLSYSINEKSQIEKLKLDVSFDSKDERLKVTDLSGDLFYNEHSYQLSGSFEQFTEEEVPKLGFDFKLNDQKKDVVRLAGHGERGASSEMFLYFDPHKTHFLSTDLSISEVILSSDFHLINFKMNPRLTIKALSSQLDFALNNGFISQADALQEILNSLDGAFQINVEYKELLKAFVFNVEGKSLNYLGESINKFSIKGEHSDLGWVIQSLEVDDFFAKGTIVPNKGGYHLSEFEIKQEETAIIGSAIYRENSKQLVAEIEMLKIDLSKAKLSKAKLNNEKKMAGNLTSKGTLTLSLDEKSSWKIEGILNKIDGWVGKPPIHFQNDGPLHLLYTKAQGLLIDRLVLSLHSPTSKNIKGNMVFGKFTIFPLSKRGKVEDCSFSMSKEMINYLSQAQEMPSWLKEIVGANALSGSAQLEFSSDNVAIQGVLKAAPYKSGVLECDIKDFSIVFAKDDLNFLCKATVGKVPLKAQFKKSLGTTLLTLQEDAKTPGIVLNFKPRAKGLTLDSIHGSLHGINAAFSNTSISLDDATVLSGKLTLDMKSASEFLNTKAYQAIDTFKIGKGYEIGGNLILSKDIRFNGTLQGKDIELLGYQMQSLVAQVDCDISSIRVRNLSLFDDAGTLEIKLLKIEKNSVSDKWGFYTPLVQAQDFKPSLLRSSSLKSKKSSNTKPFVIKNLSFVNALGEFGDKTTISGRGSFNFTNTFRKEMNLLDIPLDLIKNIGLDPGLLTPISGEVDYEMKNGKVFLTELRNAFSEGRRSEFYLPLQETSYLDLDGNLHVDLKMRQNVLIKITEPFTVSIRGTLAKPSYSLSAF